MSITGQNYLFCARQQAQSKVPEATPYGGSHVLVMRADGYVP
jgi:hypothetical protein